MRKIVVVVVLTLLLVGALLYGYIEHSATPIVKILNNPREYERSGTTISGEVTDRTSLIFLKYFSLKDDTGQINVITERALPLVGTRLRVRGHAEEAFSIGASQMIVFREEQDSTR